MPCGKIPSPESKRSEPVRSFADIIAAGIEAGDEPAEGLLERALKACVGQPLPRALADACIARLSGMHRKRTGPSARSVEFVAKRQVAILMARGHYRELKKYVEAYLRGCNDDGSEYLKKSIELKESPHEATLRLVGAIYFPTLAPRTVGNLLKLKSLD